MPSRNTYRLTWVSLTLDVGYLFTAAPAKRSRCSLPWMRGISLYLLTTAPPDLEHGLAPLGPPVPTQPLLLGRGVAPLSRRLTECGPLEKEMANHFSILALRNS